MKIFSVSRSSKNQITKKCYDILHYVICYLVFSIYREKKVNFSGSWYLQFKFRIYYFACPKMYSCLTDLHFRNNPTFTGKLHKIFWAKGFCRVLFTEFFYLGLTIKVGWCCYTQNPASAHWLQSTYRILAPQLNEEAYLLYTWEILITSSSQVYKTQCWV